MAGYIGNWKYVANVAKKHMIVKNTGMIDLAGAGSKKFGVDLSLFE